VILTSYINNNTAAKRKIYGIIGALITLIIPFVLLLNNADHHLESSQSICPFKMLTGFPCPGCGITKSLVSFYEGDIFKSFSYHIFGPFVIAFCVITIAVLSIELITKKEYLNSWLYNKKLAYGLGIFLAVYHTTRLIYFVYSNSWDSIAQQSIWK
jgi:Protein of unknown function (DUF2752)